MALADLNDSLLIFNNNDLPLETKLKEVNSVCSEICAWRDPYASASLILEFMDLLHDEDVEKAIRARLKEQSERPKGRCGKISDI